jgi:hypothetical protein
MINLLCYKNVPVFIKQDQVLNIRYNFSFSAQKFKFDEFGVDTIASDRVVLGSIYVFH